MCGISGIIDQNGNMVKSSEIEKINRLIAHRGPDSDGFFYEKNFAFAHRRLSIIDLSDDGHQPMSYDNRFVITYNGEIYNYIEIKEQLVKDGYRFKSNSDTEVILASYAKWGEACVEHFNGMWAFAIYDKMKETIFCSRDRFGIKPFYYTIKDSKFIFGSEIKQLLEFFDEKIANKSILIDYLIFGLEEHTNETFFKDIYKLEPSHNLTYDLKSNKYEIKRYYSIKLDKNIENMDEDNNTGELRAKIESAIDLRLRSDVKVGSCLSGGLDSSSIVSIASKKYFDATGERFCAIHAKSVEGKTDESHYAKMVAKHCNLDLKIVEPKLDDISGVLEDVIYTQEEPFGSPSIFMQYFVMQEARKNGCTVMLDGQGGDETLFGYEAYYSYYFASLLKSFKFVKYLRDLKRIETFRMSKKRLIRESISTLVRDKLLPLESYLRGKRMGLKANYDSSRLKDIFKFKSFKELQIQEIVSTNLPQLLKYEDRNSMKHSIETRLPLLDFNFVQSAISSKDEVKFKDGYLKYLLRRVVTKLLPKEIVWRKSKFGFEAPTDMWIDKNREKMAKEIEKSSILSHILDINSNIYKSNMVLWRLYNIALWEKIYKVEYKG